MVNKLEVVDLFCLFFLLLSASDRFSRRRLSVFPQGLGLSVAYHFLKSSRFVCFLKLIAT